MTVPRNVEQFILAFASAAKKNEQDYAVPREVTLAQAGIESGWGKHAPQFNFFGIKADPAWKGRVQTLRTREVVGGKDIYIDAKFRAYDKPEESFRDHALFLRKNSNYRKAFETTDPREFARRVAQGGYATDPNYAKSLISVMTWIEQVLGPREQPAVTPSPPALPQTPKPGLFALFLQFLRRIFGGRNV